MGKAKTAVIFKQSFLNPVPKHVLPICLTRYAAYSPHSLAWHTLQGRDSGLRGQTHGGVQGWSHPAFANCHVSPKDTNK